MKEDLKKKVIENNKAHWFIEHIQKHLDKDKQVVCTICNKTVDEIGEETFDLIVEEIKKRIILKAIKD